MVTDSRQGVSLRLQIADTTSLCSVMTGLQHMSMSLLLVLAV
jgi:hypothetical protein